MRKANVLVFIVGAVISSVASAGEATSEDFAPFAPETFSEMDAYEVLGRQACWKNYDDMESCPTPDFRRLNLLKKDIMDRFENRTVRVEQEFLRVQRIANGLLKIGQTDPKGSAFRVFYEKAAQKVLAAAESISTQINAHYDDWMGLSLARGIEGAEQQYWKQTRQILKTENYQERRFLTKERNIDFREKIEELTTLQYGPYGDYRRLELNFFQWGLTASLDFDVFERQASPECYFYGQFPGFHFRLMDEAQPVREMKKQEKEFSLGHWLITDLEVVRKAVGIKVTCENTFFKFNVGADFDRETKTLIYNYQYYIPLYADQTVTIEIPDFHLYQYIIQQDVLADVSAASLKNSECLANSCIP